MKTSKYLVCLSITLFSAGAALGVPLSMTWLEQQKATSKAPAIVLATAAAPTVRETPAVIKGTPRHILVPSLAINLTVADGTYNAPTGTWTLTDKSAFYATPTSPVNSDSGNTLLYGHNIQKVFGRLSQLKVGAEVIITTDNGYAFTYTYTTSEIVSPTNVSIFAYTGKPRLTLQTCSGVWSENRQLFYFELKDYRKT